MATADTTATAVSTNPTTVVLGQPITITALVTDTTAGHTTTIPTGGVTFMDTLGIDQHLTERRELRSRSMERGRRY